MYFLYGSSDERIGLSLKLAPEPLGVHLSMAGPCEGVYMIPPWGMLKKTARKFGPAQGWARAVFAGTIASRNGNPKATPAPFSTALREICFFVMNIGFPCFLL